MHRPSFACLFLSLNALGSHGDLAGDRRALVRLYESLNGPAWPSSTSHNWMSNKTVCEWSGIVCSPDGVSSIKVSREQSVSGELPGDLFEVDLRGLTEVNFGYTNLNGELPWSLFTLPELVAVVMSNTTLSGTIPKEIGQARNLQALFLGSNGLSGLTGYMPKEIGNLTELRTLILSGNNIAGLFPGSITNLKKLEQVLICQNIMSGPLPPGLVTLPNLITLGLDGNSFYGSLPDHWSPTLEYLSLAQNSFDGSIPPGLSDAAENLKRLDLGDNRLTGSIPPELGLLRKLEFLNLSDNPLSGSLPPELCRLFNSIDTGLDGISVFLLLRQTNLGGPLPECIGSMQGLQVLSIAHSNFSGSIPAGLGAMRSLLKFVAEDNALEGVMPIGLCNSSSLTEIDVAFNKITGLPDCALPSLLILSAGHNAIRSIPNNFWASPALEYLYMADNWLDLESARPHPIYGKALQLRSLDVSDNALNCSMGSFYEKFAPLLPSLQSLYLRRCMLWGNVLGDQDRQWEELADAGALQMLMLLDLSQNALTGNAFYSEERVAPGLLSNPFLVFCNLSYTHVEATIPLFQHTYTSYGYSPNLDSLDLSHRTIPGYKDEILMNDCITNQLLQAKLTLLVLDNLAPCNVEKATSDTELAVSDDPNSKIYFKDSEVTCPERLAPTNGIIVTDQSFLSMRGCACDEGNVWMAAPVCSKGLKKCCAPCPSQPLLVCDPRVNIDFSRAGHELAVGFFPVLDGKLAENKDFLTAVILQCRSPSDCNVEPKSSVYKCGEGRDAGSLLCSRCLPGYFSLDYECYECKGYYKYLIFITLPLAAFVLLAFVWKRTEGGGSGKSERVQSTALFSIFFFGLQLLSGLKSYSPERQVGDGAGGDNENIRLPPWFSSLKEFFNLRPWALECVHPGFGFESYFWIKTLAPPGLAFLWLSALYLPCLRRRFDRLRLRMWGLVCIMLELLFFPLVVSTLSVVKCESHPQAKVDFLAQAPFLSCADAATMRPFGYCFFALYGLGVPGWIGWRLYRSRADMGSPLVADLRSLTAPLAEGRFAWMWPSMVLLRKLILAVALNPIFWTIHDAEMPLFISVMLLSSSLLQVSWSPYKSRLDSCMEPAVLILCWFVYAARILESASEGSDAIHVSLQLREFINDFELLLYIFMAGAIVTLVIHRVVVLRIKQQHGKEVNSSVSVSNGGEAGGKAANDAAESTQYEEVRVT